MDFQQTHLKCSQELFTGQHSSGWKFVWNKPWQNEDPPPTPPHPLQTVRSCLCELHIPLSLQKLQSQRKWVWGHRVLRPASFMTMPQYSEVIQRSDGTQLPNWIQTGIFVIDRFISSSKEGSYCSSYGESETCSTDAWKSWITHWKQRGDTLAGDKTTSNKENRAGVCWVAAYITHVIVPWAGDLR